MKIVPLLGPAMSPDVVLQEAVGKFASVVVIGYDHEGNADFRASTNIDDKSILWLIEKFKLGPLLGLAVEEQ